MIALAIIHLLIKGLKAIFTPLIAIPLVGYLVYIISSIPWDYKTILFLICIGLITQALEFVFKNSREAYYDKKLSIQLYNFPQGLTNRDYGYYVLSFFPAVLVLFALFLLGNLVDITHGNAYFLFFISCILVFSYAINPFLTLPRYSVNGHSYAPDQKLMPIHKAAKEGDLTSLKKHITKVKTINSKTNFGNSALHFAIKANKYNAVQLLIEADAVINATNNKGETPLMYAASNQNLKMLRLLLENNANLKPVNKNLENVLFYCLSNLTVFRLLVENQESKSMGTNSASESTFQFQDKSSNIQLTSENAFLYHINSYGESLISVAAGLTTKPNQENKEAPTTGAKEIVSYLLEKGLSANGLDTETTLPLIKAIASDNYDVVSLLIEQGADVNKKNKEQQTALNTAIATMKLSIIKLLVTNNADVNLSIHADFYFKNHVSPLEFAYSSTSLYAEDKDLINQDAVVDYLIQNGAKISKESTYKRVHILREIRLLNTNTLSQHIKTLPEVHLPTKTLLLTTDELKFYLTYRFLQKKTYLNMDFNDLAHYFKLIISNDNIYELAIKDSFLMLFLNDPEKAVSYILNTYQQYPEKKKVIQDTAKNILKSVYDQPLKDTSENTVSIQDNSLDNKPTNTREFKEFILAELDQNNKAQLAIDRILKKRLLHSLINQNQDQKTTDQMAVLSKNLEDDFKNALHTPELVAVYIRNSEKLAIASKEAKKLSITTANYTTKLLITSLKQSFFKDAKQLFFSYINNICPYTGLCEKAEDIASNALILSLLTKDDTISKLVFEVILNNDFNIKTTRNEVLLYNLACYYALKNNKTNLLIATEFALKNGKEAKQFLEDKDFISFINDPDFKAVLNPV